VGRGKGQQAGGQPVARRGTDTREGDGEPAQLFAAAGFEVVERRHLDSDSGWPTFRKARGVDPDWLGEAQALYREGYSGRETAQIIGSRHRVRVSEQTMRRILRQSGVAINGSAEPLGFWALRNRNEARNGEIEQVAQDLAQAEGVQLDELLPQLVARRRRTLVQPLKDPSPLWGDVDVVRHFCSLLNEHHCVSAERLGGLMFENVLAAALQRTGKYQVDLFPPTNPGADIRVAMRNQQALTPYSLKSSKATGLKGGGRIEIQSLAPHGVGHVPETPGECQRAAEAAVEHLSNYLNIAYLQAIETHFPDDPSLPAWRYNIIEVPHAFVRQVFRSVTDADFEAALAARKSGGALTIPIIDHTGKRVFNIHIGSTHIGVTAIEPGFYRTQISIWTAPPTEAVNEIGQAERQPFRTGKRRRAQQTETGGPAP
jgi:hypothetical protein